MIEAIHKMSKPNVIKEKSFLFACDVIDIYKKLITQREFVISRQLLKSGTSVGANVREAEHAQSRADFVSKLSIALKEASETDYWIDLLKAGGFFDELDFTALKKKISELLRLLISILNATKNK